MKTLKVILIWSIVIGFLAQGFGQNKPNTVQITAFGNMDFLAHIIDSLTCTDRGHISGGLVMSTSMWCDSYLEEDSCKTVQIHPSCNTISYKCQRCKAHISEPEKERRIILFNKCKY